MSTNGTTAIQKAGVAEAFELALVSGDLSKLSTDERLAYYRRTCESLGLNALTKPFEYINLNGKLTMYARKDCTDQLRSIKRVSVRITSREQVGDVYAVTACATLPDGRTDESIGAVATAGLKGDALANALMKAETKAKRRVTLSVCGLGLLDESELETVSSARPVPLDDDTAEKMQASLDRINGYRKAIAEASSDEHLAEIGGHLSAEPESIRTALRKEYGAKKKALKNATQDVVERPIEERIIGEDDDL